VLRGARDGSCGQFSIRPNHASALTPNQVSDAGRLDISLLRGRPNRGRVVDRQIRREPALTAPLTALLDHLISTK